MDSKLICAVLAALFAVLCVTFTSAMSIPKDKSNNLIEKEYDPHERATWLDTRDEEEDLEDQKMQIKSLLYLTLQEMKNQGELDSILHSSSAVDKRGRWQGFCFRRTRSGRFLPYICWKGGNKGSRK